MDIEDYKDGLDDIFDDMERMEYSIPSEESESEIEDEHVEIPEKEIIKSNWNVIGALNRLSEATIVPTAVSLVKHIKSLSSDYSKEFYDKCVLPALDEQGIISASYLASLAAVIGLVDQAMPARYFGTMIIKHLLSALPEDRIRLRNALILASYLFFFDIMSTRVLIDLLKILLAEDISEKSISSITIIMTTCGQKLAFDVPGIHRQLNESLEASVIKSVGSLDPEAIRKAHSFKLVFLLEIFKTSSEKQIVPDFINVLNRNYREACQKMGGRYSGAASDPNVSKMDLMELKKFSVGEQEVKKEAVGKYNDDTLNRAYEIMASGAPFHQCANMLNSASLLAGRKAHKVASLIISLLLEQTSYESYFADLSAAIIGENPSTCRIAITAAVWDVFKNFDNLKPVPMTSFSRYLATLWLSGTVTWEVFRKAIPYLRSPTKKSGLALAMTLLLILRSQPNFGFVLSSYKNDESKSLIASFGTFIDILEATPSLRAKPLSLCKLNESDFETMMSKFKHDLIQSRHKK